MASNINNIEVRKVCEHDAADLFNLFSEVNWYYPVSQQVDEEMKSQFHDSMLAQIHNTQSDFYDCYVAVDKNIVAYASIHYLNHFYFSGMEGFITDVFVSEKFRSAGIASQFIDILKMDAQSKKMSSLVFTRQ